MVSREWSVVVKHDHVCVGRGLQVDSGLGYGGHCWQGGWMHEWVLVSTAWGTLGDSEGTPRDSGGTLGCIAESWGMLRSQQELKKGGGPPKCQGLSTPYWPLSEHWLTTEWAQSEYCTHLSDHYLTSLPSSQPGHVSTPCYSHDGPPSTSFNPFSFSLLNFLLHITSNLLNIKKAPRVLLTQPSIKCPQMGNAPLWSLCPGATLQERG